MTSDVEWLQDGVDKEWFYSESLGSVRSAKSYRAGGWWFLPKWLPDEAAYDFGPFRSKVHAQEEAVQRAVQEGLFRPG